LGQNFVNEPHIGSKLVLVDVEGKEAANIAKPSDDQDRRLLGHDREFCGGRFVIYRTRTWGQDEGTDASTSAAQI
jgi:hypothetical protein